MNAVGRCLIVAACIMIRISALGNVARDNAAAGCGNGVATKAV